MRMNPHHPVTKGAPKASEQASLQSRRRLLKAAVGTAPLIATLPSGMARAQASVRNCVVQAQDEAADGQPSGFIVDTNPGGGPADGYLRIEGTAETWALPDSTNKILYNFTVDGNQISVNAAGDWEEPGDDWSSIGSSPVELLVLYRPSPEPPAPVTDIAAGVEQCELDDVDWSQTDLNPQPPQYCIWPIAKVQPIPQPGGNFGLAESCYCSVRPGETICQ
jgi:hypothetical protein